MSEMIEVTSCRDCPFNFENAGVFCWYKEFCKYDKKVTTDEMGESELNGGLPDSCPLRIYKVTIVGKSYESRRKKMIKEKIIITTDIIESRPFRRVHVQAGEKIDFYLTFGDDDDLEKVLGSVGIAIKNELRRAEERK
jgi:hypothetical protein